MKVDPCEHRDQFTGEPVCSKLSTHRHFVQPGEFVLLCDKHACAKCVRYRSARRSTPKRSEGT